MKTLYILFFVFTSFFCSAQCPDNQKVIEKLTEISTFENKKIISELLKLESQCRKCKFEIDSTNAKIFHILGRTYWYEKDLTLGESYTRKAINLNSKKTKTAKEANLINSYFNLGKISLDKNNSKNALKYFYSGINYGKNYPQNLIILSRTYNEIANINYFNGDYENAVSNSLLGMSYAQKAKNNIWFIYNGVENSQALIELNKLKEAEILLDKLIISAKNEPDKSYLANLYSMFGLLKLKQENFDQSIDYYNKAYIIYQTAKDNYGSCQALINKGFAYKLKGEPKNAILNYNQALESTTDISLKTLIFDNIGVVYKENKDFKKALNSFQKSFEVASINFKNSDITVNPNSNSLKISSFKRYIISNIKDKADTWLNFYKYEKNKSHLRNALKTYKTADQMIDIMRWEHSGEQSKLFWRNKTRKIYENAIETCFLLNQPEDAFYFFEKSRAVLLNDKLNELGAKQLLSEVDLKKETDIQQKLDELRKLVAEINTEENQRKLLTAETNQLNFIKQLEIQNPAYYQYKYDTTSLKIADVRTKILDKKQSLIEYFVGNEAVYAFVLTPESAKVYQIIDNTFTNNTATLMNMMANEDLLNKNFTQYLSLSNQFYKKYIEPLKIPKGRVIVSSDGVIVPFGALSYSATSSQWLVKDYVFSNTYSAKFLSKEKNKSTFQTKSFLGVAPVSFANNPIKLSNADVSLKKIAEQFTSPKILLNNEANKQNFLTQMADYQIIQLYTHALANDSLSQLYFSDSTLKASELTSNQLLPTQLIVLSACQTGIGKDVKGEGVFSLARSFATLGISSMLTTLWQVDNESTYQLTELFYKYLKQGFPKDEAINKAQNEYLAINQSSKNLPNFWAGMVLIGDSSAMTSNYWYLWIFLGILVACILGIWIWKKANNKKERDKHLAL